VSGRTLLFSVLTTFVAVTCAPAAGAYMYYGGEGDGGAPYIARANMDGGAPNPNYIPAVHRPCAIAVNATRIYWATSSSITWANLDRSELAAGAISGLDEPCGIAVDAQYLYWVEEGRDVIGRMALDQSTYEPDFIKLEPGAAPCGLAVDATGIYWGESTGGLGFAIRRAPLMGGAPETMTSTATGKCGLALDAEHVYWSNANLGGNGGPPGTTIGRMDKQPESNVNNAFITGATNPCGVAANASGVYWANYNTGSLGHAALDGTGADQFFVSGLTDPCGIAVDSQGPAVTPGEMALGKKPKLDREHGTATVQARVKAPGELVLSGKNVREASADVEFGRVSLPIKATGAAKRRLTRRGAAKVHYTVTFSPEVGSPTSSGGVVKLVRED
jgi:hypothetical protein